MNFKKLIQEHIYIWTALVMLFTTFVLPFLQKVSTEQLSSWFLPKNLEVHACSPLRAAHLSRVVLRNGRPSEVRPVSEFSMMNRMRVVVRNNGEKLQNASALLKPINSHDNSIWFVEFLTDNLIGASKIDVKHDAQGAFHIDLKSVERGQTILFEVTGIFPTHLLFELTGENGSVREFIRPGECSNGSKNWSLEFPTTFHEASFSESEGFDVEAGRPDANSANSEPIVLNIGENTTLGVFVEFNCGAGLVRDVVPLGGPLRICELSLNGG